MIAGLLQKISIKLTITRRMPNNLYYLHLTKLNSPDRMEFPFFDYSSKTEWNDSGTAATD
ncbi:hypothetical protein [Pedobacter jejuensis]|uniref:hypothetical protein n=1 Tax=Pedobacter jejuensis TaxID=1268550 RepID=UPI00142D599F|nr:hypothetical protein [Pedobacter jejuensis]